MATEFRASYWIEGEEYDPATSSATSIRFESQTLLFERGTLDIDFHVFMQEVKKKVQVFAQRRDIVIHKVWLP